VPTDSELLAATDPAMAAAIEEIGPPVSMRRRYPGGAFGALARSILYQQLAGKAAAAIHARFLALFDGPPTPEAVLALPEEALRGAGLSGSKAASIRDLGAKVLDGTVALGRIGRFDDDAIIEQLVTVRGIGRWTAEMFLMFHLGRPDVWPTGDFGVRKGWAIIHGRPDAMPTPGELADAGEIYRPHRSLAAWYCWRACEKGFGT
jgi:3-methyladenine DNA glycosylase/8-oxoguanine DNA glycosylase